MTVRADSPFFESLTRLPFGAEFAADDNGGLNLNAALV
jgi:hypothetical protein